VRRRLGPAPGANRWIIEALALTGVVLFTIWCLHGLWLLSAAAAIVIASLGILWSHGETPHSLGLTFPQFASAVGTWKWWLAAALFATAILGGRQLLSINTVIRGGKYLVWCCFQQFLYQNIVYKGVRAKYGPRALTRRVSGVIFAIIHLPNPILVPATLIWGTFSSRLFEQQRSIFALGLLQMLLSNLLLWITPIQYHHGFRIGPSYFVNSTVLIIDFFINMIFP
jgi:hypothetical protein